PLTDINTNIMPQSTTLTFSTPNGTIVSAPTTFTVPNSTACLAGAGPGFAVAPATVTPAFVCPATSAVPLGSAPLAYAIIIKSDVTQTSAGTPPTLTCNPNGTRSGVLTVTVRTPSGDSTTTQIPGNE